MYKFSEKRITVQLCLDLQHDWLKALGWGRNDQIEPGALGTPHEAPLFQAQPFSSRAENEKAQGNHLFLCQLEVGGTGGKKGPRVSQGSSFTLPGGKRCTPRPLPGLLHPKQPLLVRDQEEREKQIQGQKGRAWTCRLEGQSVPTRDPPFSCKLLPLTFQCDPGEGSRESRGAAQRPE